MARREDLMEALDAIETGMCKVKESRDIWQNELVYALCQGVRLLLTVLAFNLVGDGLRDAFDPKMKR